MNQSYYYLGPNNEPLGPYSWEDLKKLLQEGRISSSTLVGKPGSSQWETFEQAEKAMSAQTQPAPPAVVVPSVAQTPGGGGSEAAGPGEASAAAQPQAPSQVSQAFRKAWEAFCKLGTDPVGKLPAVAEELGATGAQSVGLAFGAVFMASALVTGFLAPGLQKVLRGQVLQCVLVSAVPFACFLATLSLTRLLFRGKGGFGTDCLIAGTAGLPIALLIPLVAVLGVGNVEVCALLTVLALCTCFLLLYAGCTGVNRLSTQAATLAMPIICVGSIWLAKVLVVALVGPKLPAFDRMF